jgi:hypothetical protein
MYPTSAHMKGSPVEVRDIPISTWQSSLLLLKDLGGSGCREHSLRYWDVQDLTTIVNSGKPSLGIFKRKPFESWQAPYGPFVFKFRTREFASHVSRWAIERTFSVVQPMISPPCCSFIMIVVGHAIQTARCLTLTS